MSPLYERRRHERKQIDLKLEVNRVYKQDYVEFNDLQAKIQVFDISKGGIGFKSKAELMLNYYFDSKITLEEGNYIYAVIRIVRIKECEEGLFEYGAEFVGLAPFLENKISKFVKANPNINRPHN